MKRPALAANTREGAWNPSARFPSTEFRAPALEPLRPNVARDANAGRQIET